MLSIFNAIEDHPFAIFCYKLHMKKLSESTYTIVYDGSFKPAITYFSIYDYLGDPLGTLDYNLKVVAINYIGESVASDELTVNAAVLISLITSYFPSQYVINKLIMPYIMELAGLSQ